MDQTRARETAKDATAQAGKTANEAAQRVGEEMQPALDQGKSMAQNLANRASEAGRQARDRAGEFVESVTPQARQVASNLYDQGSRSAEDVRQYAPQDPPRRDVDCWRDRVRAWLSRPRALTKAIPAPMTAGLVIRRGRCDTLRPGTTDHSVAYKGDHPLERSRAETFAP
jgi:hypothetical protein